MKAKLAASLAAIAVPLPLLFFIRCQRLSNSMTGPRFSCGQLTISLVHTV
jgi:hypothetical protein